MVQLTPTTLQQQQPPSNDSAMDVELIKPASKAQLLPVVPVNEGPPSVPLYVLLDFAIQKVYHDLTVRAELVQNEPDGNKKKMGIIEFANSTRLLFIRLLALVKWLKSSSKVETCTRIMYYLDQQCSYFVDTADKLSFLASEELTHARFSSFQIPSAVDVLTLGSYPRLPVCIKERFVKANTVSGRERVCVLNRLNQVIRHRMIKVAPQLPASVTSINIANGMMRLTVSGEFSVCVTVRGESADTPWTLLDVRILVDDMLIGDGQPLVHPLQLHFLHQCAQARMNASGQPLLELYSVLHAFCVSLQLDVLYCQAVQLIHDTLAQHAQLEEYVAGQRLTVGYWRRGGSSSTAQHNQQQQQSMQHRVTVSVEAGALAVTHGPHAPGLPSTRALLQHCLSLQQLITNTQIVRALHRLNKLRGQLQRYFGHVVCRQTGDNAPSLTLPVMQDGASYNADEWLVLTVSTYSGLVTAQLPCLAQHNTQLMRAATGAASGAGRPRLLIELQNALNADKPDVAAMHKLVAKLRSAVMVCRCVDTCAQLPVQVVHRPDLLLRLPAAPPNTHNVTLMFDRDNAYFMAVSMRCDSASGCVSVDYQVLSTTSSGGRLLPALAAHADKNAPANIANSVLVSLSLRDIKHRRQVRQQSQSADDDASDETPPPNKRLRACVLSALCANVSAVDEHIMWMQLVHSLNALRITHAIQDNAVIINSYAMCKCLASAEEQRLVAVFTQECVRRSAITLRLHDTRRTMCTFELDMYDGQQRFDDDTNGEDVKSDSETSAGRCERLVREFTCNTGERIQAALREHVQTLLGCARLHAHVPRIRYALAHGARDLFKIVSYNMRQLVVGYGPGCVYTVCIEWQQPASITTPATTGAGSMRLTFDIAPCPSPAGSNVSYVSNPHAAHTTYYEQQLAKHNDPLLLLTALATSARMLAGLHALQVVQTGEAKVAASQ